MQHGTYQDVVPYDFCTLYNANYVSYNMMIYTKLRTKV